MCEKTYQELLEEWGHHRFMSGLYTGALAGVLGTLLCMFANGKIFP